MSEDDKRKIRDELTRLRGELGGDAERIGESVQVKERILRSIRNHPGEWMIGGLIGGYALSRVLARRQDAEPPRRENAPGRTATSLVLGLLGIAAKQIMQDCVPDVTRHLREKIETEARRKSGESEDPHPSTESSKLNHHV